MGWILLLLSEPILAAAEVEYVPQVSPTVASYPPTLQDIASRLPLTTDARDVDLVTYSHEGSHFLCKGREGHHGIYVGDGLRVYVPNPPLVTGTVLDAIGSDLRGDIWKTYREQGRSEYWHTRPLMLLDEWVAYYAGSKARRELGLQTRQESDRHCAEMARYAAHLCRMAKACEGYPHKELLDFCVWQEERCRRLIPEWNRLFRDSFR